MNTAKRRTVIGANINDPTSPAFWIAVGTEVVFAVSSTLVYYFYKKKKKAAFRRKQP